jgi:hypothetical protein
MKGFATSNNPYMSGMRPRSFFAARVEMLRKEKMYKNVYKDSNTNESDEKSNSVKKAA